MMDAKTQKMIDRAIQITKPMIKNYEGLASSTPPMSLTYMKKEGSPSDRVYAYWDKFAKIWTIGWGSTYINGRKVREDDVITRAQAEKLFEDEVIEKEKSIRKIIDLTKVNENQYAVLISIAYNAGPGGLTTKSRIASTVNSGRPPQEVSAIIKDSLIRAKGEIVPGLVRRRREESEFYLKAPEFIKTPTGIGISIGIFLVLVGASFFLYNKLIKK